MDGTEILCVGELAIDFIANTDMITDNPSSVILKSFRKFYGGMGGNAAVAARIFGPSVAVLAYLEDSPEGMDYRNYLKGKGIDVSNVLESKWASHPRCFIVNQGEKTRIFFYAGALIEEPERYVRHASLLVNKSNPKALYCGSMSQEINNIYLSDSNANVKAFAPAHNTYTIPKDKLESCLENTDILFLNEHESGIVERLLKSNLRTIAKDFDIGILAKTLGKAGSQVIFEGEPYEISPCKAAIERDHTGAGDAYAGAFLANYIKTEDPIYSAKLASAASSFVVEEIGCQTGLQQESKIMERAKSTYGEIG